jgi:putative MATE family efflux protein
MSLTTGPILPTLLRLAAPNVLALTTSVSVAIAETLYVGLLGTTPLAAMALVFPFAMLVQMMSAGAMGGGVSSAVSRALGARDPDRARTLAVHALAIGAAAGLASTAVFLVFGPMLYRLLGGRGEVLDEAVRYGSVLFCGAVLTWLANTLASVLRGTGDMRVPSSTLLAMAVLQIVLGGALGLGLGPLPRLGMPGVAIGQVVASLCGVAFFAWWLGSGRARLRLTLRGVSLQREMFLDILKVGALACLSPLQTVLAALILTGLVARLGVAPLAGYGIGQRLEFLLVPIAFGIGVAAVPMVGMAIGAGDVARARRVAWTAATVSGAMIGVLGIVVALLPDLWGRLFTDEAEVLAHTRSYLHWVGPAFGTFGFGLTLYFASQGSGKVLGPVLAASARLAVVAVVGMALAGPDAQAWHYFALVSGAMVVYGIATATAVFVTRWQPQRRASAASSATTAPSSR